MKKEGSHSEFIDQRDDELLRAFRRVLTSGRGESLAEMFGMAAKEKASRFWVSERRATEVISLMMRRPESVDTMLPEKRRMFEKILRRVRVKMREREGRPLYHYVFDAVNEEAPEFYLTPKSAKIIIYAARRRRKAAAAARLSFAKSKLTQNRNEYEKI